MTAALSYLVYNIAIEDENCILLTIGTAISVLLTLALCMAVKFDNPKVGINIKIWCFIMFFIMFVSNLCFAWFGVNLPYYFILLAFLWVIHLFVVWKMSEIKNV